MRFPTLFKHSARLFHQLWKSHQAPEKVTSSYLQQRRQLHQKEKQIISELVYHALRMYQPARYGVSHISPEIKPGKINKDNVLPDQLLVLCAATCIGIEEHLLAQDYTAEITATLVEFFEIDSSGAAQWQHQIRDGWHRLKQESAAQLNAGTIDPQVIAAYTSVPAWILEIWAETYSWQWAIRVGEALWQSAPLSVRVNRHKTSVERVLEQLREAGITGHPGKLSPAAIICEERVQLGGKPVLTRGEIEIQDEASQLVGFVASPQPRWRILDACAGAGGKTLHLATLQHDQGHIIASDTEYNRLKEIRFRAQRQGFQSIETVHITRPERGDSLPARLAHLANKCDLVVVDAPCSSLGTSRRNPLIKYKLKPKTVPRLEKKQFAILSRYAQAVKPGGVLVYSTCSLLPAENEQVVHQFLSEHPTFTLDPVPPVLESHHIYIPGLAPRATMVTLNPADHHTDGFFIARMRRHSHE